MSEGQGAGMLTAMQDHWVSQGWDLSVLDSFRMSEGQGQGATEPTAGTGGGNLPLPEGQLSQEFGNPFLSEVDPAHKAIVEPYLKKWDGNVTKKFQELHTQYEPYKQLGDVEQLQQALYVQQLIDESPDQVLNALAEALGVKIDTGVQGLGQQQQQQQGNEGIPEEFEGLPEGFVKMFQQQQQALEAMAQLMLNGQQSAQEQAEDAQLDKLMSSLKEKHGEFDEEYVLSKMMAGAEPDEAVKAYNQLVQKSLNERGAQTPQIPILGGGGTTPLENGKKVTELSSKETRGLVAQMLAASQNAQS